ncbi:MAG: NADPH:quinone reductase [Betaproteobacteria bacterium]|nr:NADPH:quinone reductase [Betaproteobacteria bacterium]
MQAAWYEKNGPAAEVMQVGELSDPQPAAGEVRVRLYASAVNPSDVKARGGSRPIRWPKLIPNSDGAGVIEAVGEGVERNVGERVWVFNGQWDRAFGTSAQMIALPAALAVPLPDHVTFEEGACLGIPAMTAHRALFADGAIEGKTVLVTGGAGVVGHYAIQLARWAGARVVTTVSSVAKAAHACAAGAHVVINYREEDVAARIKAEVGGVDRIVEVDFGKNLPASAQVLNADGVIACYASTSIPRPQYPYPEMLWRNPLVRQVFVYTMPDAAKVKAHADIARWLAQTQPMFAIAQRFALVEVVAAHEMVERGEKIGHVILAIDQEKIAN